MKRAFITGITGQDGMHLAKLLICKGYEVHGLIRRTSFENPRSEVLRKMGVYLFEGDLSDQSSVTDAILSIQPSEVYNLAAQSHVAHSFITPATTMDITGIGALRLLQACHAANTINNANIKFYQASSSEMFGGLEDGFYNEESKFHPRSPYAAAKVMAHHACVNYREAYNMHISCGILFNHEGPYRGETFVTRKISKATARIRRALDYGNEPEKLVLGNLDACRDWGHAAEYVEGMWRMLQQEEPGDYVLATGTSWSVREFCEFAFSSVGLKWEDWVEVSDEFKRPSEVHHLLGDYSKARRILKWRPRIFAPDLARLMVEHDLRELGGA